MDTAFSGGRAVGEGCGVGCVIRCGKPCPPSKSELTDDVDEHGDFMAIFTSLIRFGSSSKKNKTK